MKRRSIIFIAVITVIAVAAAVVYMIHERNTSSAKYPVITFAEDTISVAVDASDEELLRGVTATDPEDGDVSSTLVVEGLSNLGKDNAVKVTYAAFDSRNHVTKATRTVKFVDYEGPRFSLSEPMIFKRANDINILSRIGAEDPFDGNISGNIKYSITSNSISLDEDGEYEIKFSVTNSIGDTVTLPLKVEITTQNVNPAEITLTDYIVYLKVGDEFNSRDYVVGYTVKDTEYEGASGLSIKSDVDTDEAGVYTVDYSYTSSPQSRTRLVVVVE